MDDLLCKVGEMDRGSGALAGGDAASGRVPGVEVSGLVGKGRCLRGGPVS